MKDTIPHVYSLLVIVEIYLRSFPHHGLSRDHVVRHPRTTGGTPPPNCVTSGALVCMSRRDIPVCPGDVIICRRSCAEPGFGLFAAHFLPHDVTFSINRWCQVPPGEGTPSMLGDMDVPPFWPPFLTFWRLNSIFLGYFFSSTNTKTIFWGIKTTNSHRIRSFGPKFHFSLNLFGSNFQWPAAHPRQFSDRVPPPGVPPCGGNWNMYTWRSSGQNALRTWPWSFLLITRYCFTLCKEWKSLNSFLCIYNKNCHQTNGDNRLLVPNVPIGLGRDIRDMPIPCARTHPDANKHARHIPMYRPVHSAHANKCSLPFTIAGEVLVF